MTEVNMSISTANQFGDIDISVSAIASVAGRAASECYGVVGLASKNSLRENINEILKQNEYIKGVYAKKISDGVYSVEVYIIAAYEVKITEICSEVQKKVKYVLEQTFQIPFKQVDVYVQDIKEIA